MSFIENYKKGLALLAGTLTLIIALFLPAKYALGFDVRCANEEVWTNVNWIFLALAIVFLWGEIMHVAKSLQTGLKNKISGNRPGNN